jgi:hypothetical protein
VLKKGRGKRRSAGKNIHPKDPSGLGSSVNGAEHPFYSGFQDPKVKVTDRSYIPM